MSGGAPADHTNGPTRIAVVAGTRPEAIKVAPLARALRADRRFETAIVSTGQHEAMVAQVLGLFDLETTVDLGVGRPGRLLHELSAEVHRRFGDWAAQARPDVVVVQGDTTSAMASALAAFELGIPVAHVEAGLRTEDRWSPYPEELNRRLITNIASLHFAPTDAARDNLAREGVAGSDIRVTGNTVIDALHQIRASCGVGTGVPFLDESADPAVLVTAHRRESWGEPIRRVAHAIRLLARRHREVRWIVPLHPNPAVAGALGPSLQDEPNVFLSAPLDYVTLCRVLGRVKVVVTDSGGLQEEAPALARPVVVLRDTTERPEAVQAGVACLTGTDVTRIVDAVHSLLTDPVRYRQMARAVNPFGDGHASRRCLEALAERYCGGGVDHTERVHDAWAGRVRVA